MTEHSTLYRKTKASGGGGGQKSHKRTATKRSVAQLEQN
jgi:hypothetical protein